MSLETVLPEKLAKLVHYYHEALAPDFGCGSLGSPDWDDVSEQERNRMVAAARLALLDLRSEHLARTCGEFPRIEASEGKECGS